MLSRVLLRDCLDKKKKIILLLTTKMKSDRLGNKNKIDIVRIIKIVSNLSLLQY